MIGKIESCTATQIINHKKMNKKENLSQHKLDNLWSQDRMLNKE